jgi:predicted nucleic acid-binding protein
MASVYIESSVVSYYTARMSRDLLVAAHQQVTSTWWETVLPRLEPFVSDVVLAEIARGDADAVKARLNAVQGMPLLAVTPEVIELAKEYDRAIGIPDRAKSDALHIALATWHDVDYLVTWNCVHIAGARARAAIQKVNAQRLLPMPVICTPEELLDA